MTTYLNEILDQFFADGVSTSLTHAPEAPHNVFCDVDGNLVFHVSALGVDKKDIKVTSKDKNLSIEIDRADNGNKKDVSYIVRRLSDKSIKLEYQLHEKYDLSKTKVNLSKGLLVITIPIKEESKPRSYSFDVE